MGPDPHLIASHPLPNCLAQRSRHERRITSSPGDAVLKGCGKGAAVPGDSEGRVDHTHRTRFDVSSTRADMPAEGPSLPTSASGRPRPGAAQTRGLPWLMTPWAGKFGLGEPWSSPGPRLIPPRSAAPSPPAAREA